MGQNGTYWREMGQNKELTWDGTEWNGMGRWEGMGQDPWDREVG